MPQKTNLFLIVKLVEILDKTCHNNINHIYINLVTTIAKEHKKDAKRTLNATEGSQHHFDS